MSWHEPDLPESMGVGARKILVKNLVVGQKILILKRDCIMEWINFLKELQGSFWKKIENCIIAV